MQSVETMTERILYWLSLNTQVRALAERLLQRFAVTVGDLPASAEHHYAEPGGLYRHSLEVASRLWRSSKSWRSLHPKPVLSQRSRVRRETA